jgi:CheY-like chemotaxis protein
VLVVEDDPDNAYSTSLLLRMFGHTAEAAADGEAALQAAAANPPDVVLSACPARTATPSPGGYANNTNRQATRCC